MSTVDSETVAMREGLGSLTEVNIMLWVLGLAWPSDNREVT